ncbi:uncharacterized protein LOC122385316 isoform X2 [Amphibalanus amphitrite]|uniref:uncharacterized protein LOC122385316 isoform X2 n=1 Tax=Amphibalanus amphitrite TaxID=1232801 RepID=UPI001C900E7C|nr:uncharacterized protein LOC122385316 isoform X2 [Amphibalanus amphitrite]
MAPRGNAAATVLLLAAVLTPDCAASVPSLPELPSGGVCCELAGAVPRTLLRPGVATFSSAQRICSQEGTRWPFTIYTGLGVPGSGGTGSFGCASISQPACLQRASSACTASCLNSKSCFLRFDTAKPFIVEKDVRRRTSTDSSSVTDTTGARNSSELRKGRDGETIRTNVTEALRNRLNVSSTEKQDNRFRSVDISSSSLSSLGDAILRTGSGGGPTPSARPAPAANTRPSMSVFAAGSGTASEAGKGFCCRLDPGELLQPLVGVTTLVECETRCRTKQLGFAVQITYRKWGCAGDSFKSRCAQLNTCEGCVADRTCMNVHTISLSISIQSMRNRLTGSQFAVGQVDRGRRTERLNTQIGQSSLTGIRTVDNRTLSDVSGDRQSRQVARENRRLSSEIGPDGNSRGGVSIEAAVTITEAARTNRSASQQISDRDQRALTTNLTHGQQDGTRTRRVDRDVNQDRDTVVSRREDSLEVRRLASSTGDRRAEVLPGLRSPQDGNASLTASDRNISQIGQESVFTTTVERTDDNTNLRTAAGDRTRSSSTEAALRTQAERTGARNDSNIRDTAFATEDRELGSVELSTTEIKSGSVVDRARVDGERSGGASRTVTACARCNTTSDLTESTRSDRQNQTTDHIETVTEDVTTRSRVAPGGALPLISVTAQDVRQAQTVDTARRGIGSTVTASTLNTTGIGVRSSRDREVLSVERTNGTDQVQEWNRATEVRTVTL